MTDTKMVVRHPRLTALLAANKARLRVIAKRGARRILLEHGIDPSILERGE